MSRTYLSRFPSQKLGLLTVGAFSIFFGYWLIRGLIGLFAPFDPILVTTWVGYPLKAYPHSLLIFGGLFFVLVWRFGWKAIPLWFFAYTSWEIASGMVFLAYTGLVVPLFPNIFLMTFGGLFASRLKVDKSIFTIFISLTVIFLVYSWSTYASETFLVEIITEVLWFACFIFAFAKRGNTNESKLAHT